jgi:hypothetical protein
MPLIFSRRRCYAAMLFAFQLFCRRLQIFAAISIILPAAADAAMLRERNKEQGEQPCCDDMLLAIDITLMPARRYAAAAEFDAFDIADYAEACLRRA